MHFRALALAALLGAGTLTGCMGKPDEAVQAGGNVDPTPTGSTAINARFEVVGLEIVRLDGTAGPLYEDDGGALIRYSVREPADAERAESAFVTYLFNDRIVDVQQLTLEPGKERAFERAIGDLRANRTLRVEVRAASSVAKVEAHVQDWPRANDAALTLGPLEIRLDYGLMEQDGRVLVNLTLANHGPEQPLRDFRAKMLCALPNGTVRSTNSVRIEAPTVGNRTGVDVLLDDCGTDARYGLEFKARGAEDAELVGRLLLVPVGWRPAPTP